jgi:indole-3-glycerol phosphate synthase
VTVLDEILAHKREEVAQAKRALAPAELAERARAATEPTRGFRATLARAPRPRIVAEIKRRSPSRGEIRRDFDPAACAKAYAESGAAAISVLTDARYFGGHPDHLAIVRRSAGLPILRKDFVVDAYQVDEARLLGADAVLLIAAAFAPEARERELARLRERAQALGLDALVEVHDRPELAAALASGADLVGVNNRDLRTFAVDLATTERLAGGLPEGVLLVAESGIHGPEDIARLEAAGADAFLVGEALMREADPGAALRQLRRSP